MGSCAAPSAKGDDKFITTDYLQQCRITKAGDSYLRTLLVQGARSVLIGAEKRTDLFSRWVCSLVERRGYWRAVVAIAAKNARLCWASLHYGDDFRLYSAS